MVQKKVSQIVEAHSNGNGSITLPEIDLAELQAEPAVSSRQLSVEADYDLNALRAGPEAEVVVQPDFDTVVVDKPKKTWFVFVHLEWRIEVFLLLPDDSGRQYTHLLAPKVAALFPEICRRARLIPYADRENGLYLWPILLEGADGKLNGYSQSALDRVAQGAGQWARYDTDLARQRYRIYYAHKQSAAPEWPAEGLPRLVKGAFRGNIITSADAEILHQRMGRPGKQ
jgi:hypothetical protein